MAAEAETKTREQETGSDVARLGRARFVMFMISLARVAVRAGKGGLASRHWAKLHFVNLAPRDFCSAKAGERERSLGALNQQRCVVSQSVSRSVPKAKTLAGK